MDWSAPHDLIDNKNNNQYKWSHMSFPASTWNNQQRLGKKINATTVRQDVCTFGGGAGRDGSAGRLRWQVQVRTTFVGLYGFKF
jgi:hypothetical protein